MPALDLSTPDLSPAGSWDHQRDDAQELSFSALHRPPPHFPQLGLGQMDLLGGSDHSSTLERFAPAWSELLQRAVEEPGLICDAYTRFHGYSLGNRFGALIQCQLRGLEPGPLNSFNGWRKLGYAVKEGEKALTLCMPLKGTLHREKTSSEGAQTHTSQPDGQKHGTNWKQPDVEEVQYIRAFVWKPSWFVLSQTVPLNENTPAPPVVAPLTWDRDKAFAALDITPVAFNLLDGNALGFARQRTVAVSPLAPYPFKTLFHEMAHVVLGHTTDNFRGEGNTGLDLSDGEQLPPALIEVEAECVALLCLDTLDLPGQEFCRGYIQHWAQGQDIPEKSAQRIFGAADRILCAGSGQERFRAPTAEEVGLATPATDPAHPLPPTPLPYSSETEGGVEAAPALALVLPAAGKGLPPPEGFIPPQERPAPEAFPPPPSVQSTPTTPLRLAIARSTQMMGSTAEALAQPDSEALRTPQTPTHPQTSEGDAWALHSHLQSLHGGLHPASAQESQSFARALRHLASRDPAAAREVQSLIKGASHGLKTALGRIEALLDPTSSPSAETPHQPTPPTPEVEEFDPFAGMAPGEVRRGGAPSQKTDGALPAPATDTPALPPTRAASARRAVGRTLKSELDFEKARFSKAAKAHELPLGRQHDKEMLGAMSTLLGVPLGSKRDLSSHQWARCASAIETEDLTWGKPRGA